MNEPLERDVIAKLGRTLRCGKCQRYYDVRYTEEGHGDGHGNKCVP
jgi:hypothetical protein